MGRRDAEHHLPRGQPPPLQHFLPPPPRQWTPWLVPVFFLVDIALFIYAMYLNDCPSRSPRSQCLFHDQLGRLSFQSLRENPLLGPSADTLRKLGGLDRELVLEKGEAWRCISCMFLHAGAIHLLLNMLSLLLTGIRLEREFGFLRIGLIYMLSGFAGSLMSLMHAKREAANFLSVGASGALFGLWGSMISELLINWSLYQSKCSALSTLLVGVALNLAIGFLPSVDNAAHIGGLIAGFLLGFIILIRPRYGYVNPRHVPPGFQAKHSSRHSLCQYVLLIVALILAIAGYGYALAYVYIKDMPEKYDISQIIPK